LKAALMRLILKSKQSTLQKFWITSISIDSTEDSSISIFSTNVLLGEFLDLVLGEVKVFEEKEKVKR
jgi:hypothetical protein